MSEEENTIKEKLDELRECLEYGLDYKEYISVVNAFDYIEKILEKQQKEIEIKDKVIEEMAKYIKEPYFLKIFGSRKPKIEIIKEYFRNKAKEKKNEGN